METKKLNVRELSLTEQVEVNGGSVLLIGLIIVCVTAVVNDWDNFKRGIAGRPEVNK